MYISFIIVVVFANILYGVRASKNLTELYHPHYHTVGNPHAKTAAGGTLMKIQVPSSVNLDQFNELDINERRVIVAKYPNGDPSTQELYAKDSGFSYGAHAVG
jgi:hypothetical protein